MHQALPQEHERGLGNWQAELAEIAGLFVSAHGALKALADAAGGLQVDPARMLHNIDALHGLVFAEAVSMLLARHIGKARAHELVQAWSQDVVKSGRHLREVAQEALARDDALRSQVDQRQLAALFDPTQAAQCAIDVAKRQLASLRDEFSRPDISFQ